MHTRFTSDAVAAREAPVTELAFFMLAKTSSEEETTRLEDAAMPLLEVTKTVGTCSAFAVGWGELLLAHHAITFLLLPSNADKVQYLKQCHTHQLATLLPSIKCWVGRVSTTTFNVRNRLSSKKLLALSPDWPYRLFKAKACFTCLSVQKRRSLSPRNPPCPAQ